MEQVPKTNKTEQKPKEVEDQRNILLEIGKIFNFSTQFYIYHLVGVITSHPVVIPKNKEENYVQFLVYHYQSRKFTKIIFVKTKRYF